MPARLEAEDFLLLAANLPPHVLDFGADKGTLLDYRRDCPRKCTPIKRRERLHPRERLSRDYAPNRR
jgi:hypothetical protein